MEQGQLLAIVWSKEIGEKKSDLVDALSQLTLHEALYKTLKSLQNSGAVPQRAIDEMERLYESDLIQVDRYRRTLRSWKLSEEELQEVEQEAKQFRERVKLPIGQAPAVDPPSKIDATWAEIDIKAPLTGLILEKNLTIGDIVTTDDDLFKVADLSRLVVMANIFEEDIPALMAIPEDQRTWQIRLTTNPGSAVIGGKISTIGNVIDPNQHTAVVQGWIDNSHGELRVGQFVEAIVTLPPQAGLIEIPLSGLIDDGPRKFVLIAENDSLTKVRRREVSVVRRNQKSAFLRADGPLAIHDGERVLTRGVLELAGILDEFSPAESEAAAAPDDQKSPDA